MRTINGDLVSMALDGEFDAIAHGCNCACTMGSGIAARIRETWPRVYSADLTTLEMPKEEKIGTFTKARVNNNVGGKLLVYNLYTQQRFGSGLQVNYAAIRCSFLNMMLDLSEIPCNIGIPLIGAGRGGGDWNIIYRIIDSVVSSFPHTVTIIQYDGTLHR